MADFELNLQPNLCTSGPTMYYAHFYTHQPDHEAALSRPVFIGGSRTSPRHLLANALHEFRREAHGARIGAISIKGLCHRKIHAQKPRLERVADFINATPTMQRLAVADGDFEPVVNGFGAVRLDAPTVSVIPRAAFFPTTEQERVDHPVTEVGLVGDARSHMYIALRGLEEFIQLR